VYKDDTYERGSEHNVYSETQLGQVFLTVLKLHNRFFRDKGREGKNLPRILDLWHRPSGPFVWIHNTNEIK
jgi:hypothetical protein